MILATYKIDAHPLTDGCARSDGGMGHYELMRYDATTAQAIEATGLVNRFGKTTALDGVDLAVRQGRATAVALASSRSKSGRTATARSRSSQTYP
jgi:hypothetical protein